MTHTQTCTHSAVSHPAALSFYESWYTMSPQRDITLPVYIPSVEYFQPSLINSNLMCAKGETSRVNDFYSVLMKPDYMVQRDILWLVKAVITTCFIKVYYLKQYFGVNLSQTGYWKKIRTGVDSVCQLLIGWTQISCKKGAEFMRTHNDWRNPSFQTKTWYKVSVYKWVIQSLKINNFKRSIFRI